MATSYWSLTTWYAISEAKRRHVPMVTRMTVEVERKRNVFIRAIKKIIVGRYCKKMSAGVYECKQQKEYLEHYGMSSDMLFSAPCAVNNDYFQEQSRKYDKYTLCKEKGVPDEAVVFVSTGMLIDRK